MGNLCSSGPGPIQQIAGRPMGIVGIDDQDFGYVISTKGRAGMFVERHKDERFSKYLPITKCDTKVHIVDSIAFLNMEQQYINLSNKLIGEVQYMIPIEKTNIISKLTVTMGDRKIETKIKDREVADQEYEAAEGHAVKLNKDHGFYYLNLKNVPAGKEISVKFQLIMPLEIKDRQFTF